MKTTTDYDLLWKDNWGQMQEQGPVHRHTIKTITKTVQELEISSVIDVGCGNGAILEAIQDLPQVNEIWGIDLSEEAIAIAKRRLKGTFQTMDFLAESVDRSFDLVICSQVIEHIDDDELFIRKMREISSRYLLVGTVQGRMRNSEASIGHLRNYSREELESKLQRASFSIKKVIEWGFPFYSPLYRTASEFLPQNHNKASFSATDKVIAAALFHLYRLNSSRHGDVIMILAEAA